MLNHAGFCFAFVFKAEISSRMLIPLHQDQSTVAQRAEMTVADRSLTNFM